MSKIVWMLQRSGELSLGWWRGCSVPEIWVEVIVEMKHPSIYVELSNKDWTWKTKHTSFKYKTSTFSQSKNSQSLLAFIC
jgi:hypothetical protein